MTEKEKNQNEGGDGGGEQPTIEQLQEQIANLNKGIATYRGEVKTAKEAASQALATLEAFKEAAGKKKDDDGNELEELSADDRKKLEAWAKAQGFATKEEILEERQRIQGDTLKNIETQAIDEFLLKYPKYSEDEEWEKLKKEFSLYKQPNTIAEYRKILNRVHKDLNPSDDDGKSAARAEIENRKRLNLGGRSQSTGDDGEMTIEKMQERYPRLSKEQIQGRLAEIKSLLPDKK
jgi:hypothetical protein